MDSNVPISYTEASWTGLYNFHRRQWHSKIVELCQLSMGQLPLVRDIEASLPLKFHHSFLRQWPELEEVGIYLGIGDGAAANLGSHCTHFR